MFAPVFRVTLVSARMLPLNVVGVSRSRGAADLSRNANRQPRRRRFSAPDFLVPGRIDRRRFAGHLLLYRGDLPSSQIRQGARFRLMPPRQRRPIVLALRAAQGSLEGVAQDIARLEIFLVSRLLEHEIFWKVLRIVSNVQPGEHHRRRARVADAASTTE